MLSAQQNQKNRSHRDGWLRLQEILQGLSPGPLLATRNAIIIAAN